MPTDDGGSRASIRDQTGSLARTVSCSGVGVLAGALGGYVSLVAPIVGVIAAAIGGVLLVNHAWMHRSATGGGSLFGMGLTVAWLLSPALTNRDPPVTYSPATIPVLIVGLGAAFFGLALIATAVGRGLRRHHRDSMRV